MIEEVFGCCLNLPLSHSCFWCKRFTNCLDHLPSPYIPFWTSLPSALRANLPLYFNTNFSLVFVNFIFFIWYGHPPISNLAWGHPPISGSPTSIWNTISSRIWRRALIISRQVTHVIPLFQMPTSTCSESINNNPATSRCDERDRHATFLSGALHLF